MNDRFLFRVFNKKNNRFVDNDVVNKINLFDLPRAAIKYYTVEQCTGLKDKNGVLIYEGDIVKFKISSFKRHGAVRWDKNTGGWLKDNTGQPLHTYAKTIEVIGNIHKNPELLEGLNE